MLNKSNISAEDYYNSGVDCADQEDFKSASVYFKEAIKLNPTFVDAHYNLGLAQAKLGEANGVGGRDYFEKAIPHFKEAIKLDPNFAKAYHNLGFAYYNLGVIYSKTVNVFRGGNYFQKAIDNYDKAIQLRSDDPTTYFNRSLIWMQWGDWEKVKDDLDLARDNGSNLVEAFFVSCGNNQANVRQACDELEIPPHIVKMLVR